MQYDRTCSADLVEIVMLMFMNTSSHEKLAELLTARMAGDTSAPIGWRHVASSCLAKRNPPTSANHLRPVCLIPVLKKLYLRIIADFLQPYMQKVFLATMGFRRHFQAEELVHTMGKAVDRETEWSTPLVVAKIDIKRAFDAMQHPYIFNTMLNDHFPEDLVFALAREYLDESISISTQGYPVR